MKSSNALRSSNINKGLLNKFVSKLFDHILSFFNFLVTFLVNFFGIRVLWTWRKFGSDFSVSDLFCPKNKLDPRELLSKEPNTTLEFLLGVSEPTLTSNRLLIFHLVVQFSLLITFCLCIFQKTICCYLSPLSFIKQSKSLQRWDERITI